MITAHGLLRAEERTGYHTEAATRFVERALQRGKHPQEMPARERKYLIQKEKKEDCNALFYNGFCFIVSMEGVCVTMYQAPKWFGKRDHYIGKKRIRNVKEYVQRCLEYTSERELRNGIC